MGMGEGQGGNAVMADQAEVHRLKSEYAEAHDIQKQILNTTENGTCSYPMTLVNIAQIEVDMGVSKDEIQRNIEAARSRFTGKGDLRGMIYCDMIEAALSMREGDLVRAKTLFQKCLEFAWTGDSETLDSHLLGP
ncbi:hypothetical protein FB451DRAFT_1366275 [Mycena latifolia]|nr:hypothetical protein FB451DRAFT_1366275 [Mycena latifolia]